MCLTLFSSATLIHIALSYLTSSVCNYSVIRSQDKEEASSLVFTALKRGDSETYSGKVTCKNCSFNGKSHASTCQLGLNSGNLLSNLASQTVVMAGSHHWRLIIERTQLADTHLVRGISTFSLPSSHFSFHVPPFPLPNFHLSCHLLLSPCSTLPLPSWSGVQPLVHAHNPPPLTQTLVLRRRK